MFSAEEIERLYNVQLKDDRNLVETLQTGLFLYFSDVVRKLAQVQQVAGVDQAAKDRGVEALQPNLRHKTWDFFKPPDAKEPTEEYFEVTLNDPGAELKRANEEARKRETRAAEQLRKEEDGWLRGLLQEEAKLADQEETKQDIKRKNQLIKALGEKEEKLLGKRQEATARGVIAPGDQVTMQEVLHLMKANPRYYNWDILKKGIDKAHEVGGN